MVKRIFNKKGSISTNVIIFLAIIIPFLLFATIDFPYMLHMNRRIKNALDNASSTAITKLDESQTSKGLLIINENEAKEVANEILGKTIVMDDNTGIEKNLDTKINVINAYNTKITTPSGTYNIDNPSVAIYGDYIVHGLIFKHLKVHIKYTSISQVQFRR